MAAHLQHANRSRAQVDDGRADEWAFVGWRAEQSRRG
jgi:hypothetical protein